MTVRAVRKTIYRGKKYHAYCFRNLNWLSKPHPYFFFRNYPRWGTLQIMFFELHWKKEAKR